jgi:hypothetical protein
VRGSVKPARWFCAAWLLVVASPVAADSRAAQTDLKGHIDALTQQITAATAAEPETSESLRKLRAAIAALEEKASDQQKTSEDRVNFIGRADEIFPAMRRIADKPGTVMLPKVTQKSSALMIEALKLQAIDPTNAFVERATALTDLLKQEPLGVIKTYPAVRSAARAALTELGRIEEADFIDAVERRATALQALLANGMAGSPPTSVEVMASLKALDGAMKAYRKHTDLMVDIVHAEYGDMRDRDRWARKRAQLCDATDAVRASCHGQLRCTLPALAKLCPVDPGVLIQPPHKGVWILFRCMDAQLNIHAPGLATAEPARRGAYWMGLRNEGESFGCTPENKAEAKPETKPAAQPEAKVETKPVVQPAAKPETKPETKPENKPETKAGAKPEKS